MRLHVSDHATGTGEADDGRNVWATEVPSDCTDADVRRSVEHAAQAGDKVAQDALRLVPGLWLSLNFGQPGNNSTRVYLDD